LAEEEYETQEEAMADILNIFLCVIDELAGADVTKEAIELFWKNKKRHRKGPQESGLLNKE
jgi:hypothetical protein